LDNYQRNFYILLFLGCISYLPFLGGVHLFDWDEINFAEISREMIVLQDYLRVYINFEPFWEKPPLFCWFQVISMKLFGINEYAARLPNAVAGILTLLTLHKFGTYYKNPKFGMIWALVYWGSILPFLYFKSGIIDPWFNFFTFSALFYYYKFLREKAEDKANTNWLWSSGLLLGLAVFTKGPVAFLMYGLTLLVFYMIRKFKQFPSIGQLFILLLSSLFFGGLWLGLETLQNGPWFITTFTEYQLRLLTTNDAGHQGFLGYHVVVLLLGCFPASLFAFLPIWKKYRMGADSKDSLFLMLTILLAVVVIVFSLVNTKIVHYSSLAYFPISFLATVGAYTLLEDKNKMPTIVFSSIIGLGIIFTVITAALPYVGMNIDVLNGLLAKDPFAMASLAADVEWSWWNGLPALIMMITLGIFASFLKRDSSWSLGALLVGTVLFVNSILFLNLNNIEAYTQRALIEFCKAHADENAYIKFIGTKSYAPLFYGKKDKDEDPRSNDNQWLLESLELDRDAYFIVKIHHALDLNKYREVEELYRKNGFIFYKRAR
jgi:hypothetical protein